MSQSKKIALVVPSLAEGGGVPAVARFVKDTIIRSGEYDLKLVSLAVSARDECSIRLTSPKTWQRGCMQKDGAWEGLPFTHVGAIATELEFQRYRPRATLNQVISDCNVVQVVCGTPAWANTVVGLGKPVALQVATRAVIERRARDSVPKSVTDFWRTAMTVITNKLDDRALKKVDAIQVENSWMLEYARGLNESREIDLRYAPPGVDGQLFHPLDQRSPECAPYVLCVGRLSDPRKNIGMLLDAYALLPERLRNDAKLVLAGSSGPSKAFWRRVEALGLREHVIYVARPSRDKLVRLYQRASVFALASNEEGLGVVLLESMASGIPVVSTRSGGPDGIISDGYDGFLVPLNDAAAMSSCLARLLKDSALNVEMGKRARQTVECRYDERVAGDVYLDMWDRLIKRRLTW